MRDIRPYVLRNRGSHELFVAMLDLVGTGNAADKFRHIDRYVAWRLKRLLVKRKGRNLRAGEAAAWTEDWFVGLGLHRLLGTIRYPGAA